MKPVVPRDPLGPIDWMVVVVVVLTVASIVGAVLLGCVSCHGH